MKLKPFNLKKTPRNRPLLAYFPDWGYRIAEYTGEIWRLQNNGDWHPTENTYWCELPPEPEQGAVII